MALQIRCINKTNRSDPHERISHIGGPNDDDSRWKLTLARAIEGIENGEWSFYVDPPQEDRVAVVVATSAYGNKYLKTVADGDQPNNLLSLQECP